MSDGTIVPKGMMISMNQLSVYTDEDIYPKPFEFDPYRMWRKRQEEGKANQYQFVMTSGTNLTFGHGKHACPGRFFASNEIKTLLALVLMRYEIKMDYEGGLEKIIKGVWLGEVRSPVKDGVVQLKSRKEKIPEHLRSMF